MVIRWQLFWLYFAWVLKGAYSCIPSCSATKLHVTWGEKFTSLKPVSQLMRLTQMTPPLCANISLGLKLLPDPHYLSSPHLQHSNSQNRKRGDAVQDLRKPELLFGFAMDGHLHAKYFSPLWVHTTVSHPFFLPFCRKRNWWAKCLSENICLVVEGQYAKPEDTDLCGGLNVEKRSYNFSL